MGGHVLLWNSMMSVRNLIHSRAGRALALCVAYSLAIQALIASVGFGMSATAAPGYVDFVICSIASGSEAPGSRTAATGPIRDRNVRSVSLPRRASAMSRPLTAGRRPRSFPGCKSPALFRVSTTTRRLSRCSAARSAFRALPRLSLSDARTGAVFAAPSLMRLRRTSCAQC